MDKVIALLPIKENSERVKGKNFKEICGKPLYQWILETLLKCERVSQIVVNTDSDKLITTLKKHYPTVKTVLRPNYLRGELVPMNDIISHDIDLISTNNHFIQTHTTNPLIDSSTFDEAIEEYFNNLDKIDSVFAVNRIQARTYWKNASPINHEFSEMQRTQDLEPIYEENSNFFIFSRDSFKNSKNRIGKKPLLFETPKLQSFEIDEEDDFELVKLIMEGRVENAKK